MPNPDPDLSIAYAQKFWDAGNTVVTLMFGLAFATYVVLAQSQALRLLVKEYFIYLLILALIGNTVLLYVIMDLWQSEKLMLRLIQNSQLVVHEARSARNIRVGSFLFNFGLYLSVLFFIKCFTAPIAASTASINGSAKPG